MAPRIALIGFMLESNAFAPVADEAEFRQKHWIEGEDIVSENGRYEVVSKAL